MREGSPQSDGLCGREDAGGRGVLPGSLACWNYLEEEYSESTRSCGALEPEVLFREGKDLKTAPS